MQLTFVCWFCILQLSYMVESVDYTHTWVGLRIYVPAWGGGGAVSTVDNVC